MWQQPIIDRSQSDVNYANANRASPIPLKGMRNASDLNRISDNLRHLREWLVGLGYTIPEITSRNDWGTITWGAENDIPTHTDNGSLFPRESDIANFKIDVAAIRATGIVSPQTPLTPDLPYTHYQKLNDVEKIIFDIEAALRRAEQIAYNAGAFYARSGVGWHFGKAAAIPLPEYPTIISDELPGGMVGNEYKYEIEVISSSLLGVVFEIISGELPRGLTLSNEGLILGRPLTIGCSPFTIRATNIAGYGTKELSITIETYNTNPRAGSRFVHSGLEFYFGG